MRDRIISSLLTLWIVSLVAFAAVELAPGDPAELILGNVARDVPRETLDRIRAVYRFDEPAWKRYWLWAGNLVRGELGVSLKTNRPIATELLTRIPLSASLAAASILLACAIGLACGVLSALREGGVADHGVLILSALSQSFPVFIFGLVLIYLFAFRLRWFPLYGTGGGFGLALPTVTLGGAMGFSLARMLRNALLEAMHAEPFVAALGKGLSFRKAVLRHALRNSLTPAVTYMGMRLAVLLGGVVLVESLFALPGMGSYVFEAVSSRDYPVIQACILFLGLAVVVVNFLVDWLVRAIDRRGARSGVR
jgi:peptide/nickel transport system permease protein